MTSLPFKATWPEIHIHPMSPRDLGMSTRNTRKGCIKNCDPPHHRAGSVWGKQGGRGVSATREDMRPDPPIRFCGTCLTPSKLLLPSGWAELL